MATHAELKALLKENQGRELVSKMTHERYDWSYNVPEKYYNYRILEEFTVRYDTDEKTRIGTEKKKLYRLDAVLFVEPGNRALNNQQTFTIGLEIKGNKADLSADDKLEYYLDWCDYFFIAVDSRVEGLVELAKERASADPRIGVFDIHYGIVHKVPTPGNVSTERYIRMLENVCYHYLFNDKETISIEAAPEFDTSVNDLPGADGGEKRSKVYRKEEAAEIRQKQSDIVAEVLTGVDPTAQKVYDVVSSGVDKTADIADAIGISTSAVGNALAALKKADLVDRHGGKRNATYTTKTPSGTFYKGKCLKCELYKAHGNKCEEPCDEQCSGQCSDQCDEQRAADGVAVPEPLYEDTVIEAANKLMDELEAEGKI